MSYLPLKLLLRRLKHEEEDLKKNNIWFARYDFYDESKGKEFEYVYVPTIYEYEKVPVVVKYTVRIEAQGYWKTGTIRKKIIEWKNHTFEIYILRNYPYPDISGKYRLGAPIRLRWLSPIFHPNIAPGPGYGGDGVVCWDILKKWIRIFNLISIIKGIKFLIENPNPDDPLRYPICKEAAMWFRAKSIKVIKKGEK